MDILNKIKGLPNPFPRVSHVVGSQVLYVESDRDFLADNHETAVGMVESYRPIVKELEQSRAVKAAACEVLAWFRSGNSIPINPERFINDEKFKKDLDKLNSLVNNTHIVR